MGLTFGPGRHGRNMMIRLSRGREKKSRPDCLLSLLKKCSKIDLADVMNITGKKNARILSL